MMPKTSVSPAAMRKSMTPYCRPLSVCSRTSAPITVTRVPVERKGARPGRAPRSPRLPPPPPRLPLHRALAGIGVLVALEDRALDLHREIAVRVLHSREQVEVLDREMVRVVLVRAPRRLVVGLAHGGDHALLVAEVALHRLDRAVDQHDPIVALGAVEDRRLAELLPEVSDVLLIRLVLEIGAPVTRLPLTERRFFHRRERDLVHGVHGVERDLAAQTRLCVLLQELDPHAAGIEDENRLRIRGADLADL